MTKSIQLLVFICLMFSSLTSAQLAVSGKVSDSHNSPIADIHVMLVKVRTGTIIAFATTSQKGEYTLIVKDYMFQIDSFLIQVRPFGYAQQSILLKKEKTIVNFILQTEMTELPKIVVQNKIRSIRAQGDTLNYNVKSFAKETDRSIGDVIRRLPGIDVDEQGKISYQGKPISRFYIDGDNLLDDKYNIATNGIPNDLVTTIQILDKHQPVKALENIQYNDAPALNIITTEAARKKIIIEGNASFGSPSVHEVTVNNILLKKKAKFINYYKSNNSGIDITKDVISHNIVDNQKRIGYQPLRDLLNVTIPNPPSLSARKYLLNNIGLPNINALINLNKKTQLRINAYYLYDKQYQSFDREVSFFSNTSSIKYSELQTGKSTNNTFRSQAAVTINDSNYYLNNISVIENQQSTGLANTFTGNGMSSIQQNLANLYTELSNELTIIKRTKSSKAFEFYSYIQTTKSPSSLTINPGLHQNFLNKGKNYNGLIQHLEIPTFFTTNYFTIRKRIGQWSHLSQIGISYQSQLLNSSIDLYELNLENRNLNDSFSNQASWKRMRFYVQQGFEYKSDRIQVALALPLNFQYTRYHDKMHTEADTMAKIIPFNPSLQVRLLSGRQNSIQFSAFMDNRIGNINEVYQGYIFSTYRTATSHVSSLPISYSKGLSVNYLFKKAIDGIFINTGIVYVKSSKNVIENVTLSNSLMTSAVNYFNNNIDYYSFSGSFNKYFFKIQTDIKLGFIWNHQRFNQIQNSELLQSKNNGYAYRLRVDSRISSNLLFNYTAVYSYSSATQKSVNAMQNQLNKVDAKQITQELETSILLHKSLYLRWVIENYINIPPIGNTANYLFIDGNTTFRLPNSRTDLQLTVSNILNHVIYRTQIVSTNVLSDSRYTIRPRMIMLKLNFRF